MGKTQRNGHNENRSLKMKNRLQSRIYHSIANAVVFRLRCIFFCGDYLIAGSAAVRFDLVLPRRLD